MKTDQNLTESLNQRNGSLARRVANIAMLVLLLAFLSPSTRAQSTPPSSLIIMVSSQGMTPASATVSAGIIHLSVKNSSNVETLHLRVTREGGELVKELTAPNKAEEWAIELELPAGQYTITEATNTAWSCHLTVQASSTGGGTIPGAPTNP